MADFVKEDHEKLDRIYDRCLPEEPEEGEVEDEAADKEGPTASERSHGPTVEGK
jgi:hypothetical protein